MASQAKQTTVAPMAEARLVTRQAPSELDLGAFFGGEVADLRTFSSGKQGWGFYEKKRVAGHRVQVSLNIVLIPDKSEV